MSATKNDFCFLINPKVVLAYFIFIVFNLVYLNIFAMNSNKYWDDENASSYFLYPLNLDQDKAYIPNIKMMEEGSFKSHLSNNTGIAYFYFFLKKRIGFLYDAIPIVSFAINNILILFCYWYFVGIGRKLGLRMNLRWLFFMNPALIYYSQLINKEILSLFFVLAFTYYLGQKQSFKLLLISLVSFTVRMQLLPIGLLSFWLYHRRHYVSNLLLLYITTSMAGAIVLSPESGNWMVANGSPGMVVLTQSLNQQYYIGSLVLNPVKIIQYLYDQLHCIFFIMNDGRIDLYRLRDVPFALALVYLIRPLMMLVTHARLYVNTSCRPLITVTGTFMLVLLMNPMVHSRYLFPISYNIILLGVFGTLELKRAAKRKQGQACVCEGGR